MGQPFFICESGTGSAIPMDRRERLDAHMRILLQCQDWGKHGCVLDRGRYTLAYHHGYLEVVVDVLDETAKSELRRILAFARTLGLNLFVDIGNPEDEMDDEDILRMVGNLSL